MTLEIQKTVKENSIGPSKTWVVPPRRKPGRKPKISPVTERKSTANVKDLEERLLVKQQEINQLVKDKSRLIENIEKLQASVEIMERELSAIRTLSMAQPSRIVSPLPSPKLLPIKTSLPVKDQCLICPVLETCMCTEKTAQADSSPTDFTFAFKPVKPSSNIVDDCGFCRDGSTCICRDEISPESNVLAPILNTTPTGEKLGFMYPGPTAPIDFKPGTCKQCQTDPLSYLFCQSLAAQNGSKQCCGQRDGYCEGKGTKNVEHFITCSAAYQTLSRHRNFSRSDMAALVGRLNKTGCNVEISSVHDVLRELDRKVYS